MTRTIKFRGQVLDPELHGDVKVAYGSLMIYKTNAPHSHWICPLESLRNYPVDPKSIRQLVDFDKNGVEIYEGDRVIDEFGQEYIAELSAIGVQKTADGESIAFDLYRFTLKEADGNG